MALRVPEKWRIRPLGTPRGDAKNGFFLLPGGLRVLASDGMGWEHVSVSLPSRCPTWEEMCRVKDTFWEPEDCVVQYHPPRSAYVNVHPYCLHLWRPLAGALLLPPTFLVGPVTT